MLHMRINYFRVVCFLTSHTCTMDSTPVRKIRKPNWLEVEMEILVDEYSARLKTIKGKFTPLVTAESKKKAWESISEKINAATCSTISRTADEAKKRIQDSISAVKKKESYRKREVSKTGGGPATEVVFKSWETKLLATIPQECIIGLEGAADTGPSSSLCLKTTDELENSLVCHGSVAESTVTITPEDLGIVDGVLHLEESRCLSSGSNTQQKDQEVADCSVGTENTRGSKQKSDIKGMDELLDLKKRRLMIEERKVLALERIAAALEARNHSTSPQLSLNSPFIKFN